MLAARRFVFFDVIFMSRKVEISLALKNLTANYADESDSSLASRRRMVAKALVKPKATSRRASEAMQKFCKITATARPFRHSAV
jgi:hypothetical protein